MIVGNNSQMVFIGRVKGADPASHIEITPSIPWTRCVDLKFGFSQWFRRAMLCPQSSKKKLVHITHRMFTEAPTSCWKTDSLISYYILSWMELEQWTREWLCCGLAGNPACRGGRSHIHLQKRARRHKCYDVTQQALMNKLQSCTKTSLTIWKKIIFS